MRLRTAGHFFLCRVESFPFCVVRHRRDADRVRAANNEGLIFAAAFCTRRSRAPRASARPASK
jgi:hypothetical protein